MKKCENNGCKNTITVPSIDCPGQCYSCSVKSRDRVLIAMKHLRNKKNSGSADSSLAT